MKYVDNIDATQKNAQKSESEEYERTARWIQRSVALPRVKYLYRIKHAG